MGTKIIILSHKLYQNNSYTQYSFYRGFLKSRYLTAEYQYIVRIVGNDIPGERKMIVGLTQIRGVGYMFANTILNVLKINPNQRIGYLSQEQINSIEGI